MATHHQRSHGFHHTALYQSPLISDCNDDDAEQKQLAQENEVFHWHPNAIADPAKCADVLPTSSQPCNRVACPAAWKETSWTKVNFLIRSKLVLASRFGGLEVVEVIYCCCGSCSALRRAVSVTRK